MKLVTLLQIAGLLHLGLICAGASLPRVVGFKAHLAGLPPLLRRLFYVYYGFIGGTIVAFGAITFFQAEALASGTPLAGAILTLMTLFWVARLAVAAFVFDLKPYLTSHWRKAGHYALNAVFLYLPAIYIYALWKGFAQ